MKQFETAFYSVRSPSSALCVLEGQRPCLQGLCVPSTSCKLSKCQILKISFVCAENVVLLGLLICLGVPWAQITRGSQQKGGIIVKAINWGALLSLEFLLHHTKGQLGEWA